MTEPSQPLAHAGAAPAPTSSGPTASRFACVATPNAKPNAKPGATPGGSTDGLVETGSVQASAVPVSEADPEHKPTPANRPNARKLKPGRNPRHLADMLKMRAVAAHAHWGYAP